VLPGVPAEMKAMFESVADRFSGTARHVESVAVAEPESALIDRFAELRERFDVKVGSYPGENVRVKLESEDEEAVAEAAAWLRANADVGS
jgi:molybdopterin-biosynthesis enzyme MoeA-like protein